jgi:hypothetical protein
VEDLAQTDTKEGLWHRGRSFASRKVPALDRRICDAEAIVVPGEFKPGPDATTPRSEVSALGCDLQAKVCGANEVERTRDVTQLALWNAVVLSV